MAPQSLSLQAYSLDGTTVYGEMIGPTYESGWRGERSRFGHAQFANESQCVYIQWKDREQMTSTQLLIIVPMQLEAMLTEYVPYTSIHCTNRTQWEHGHWWWEGNDAMSDCVSRSCLYCWCWCQCHTRRCGLMVVAVGALFLFHGDSRFVLLLWWVSFLIYYRWNYWSQMVCLLTLLKA